MGGRGAARVTSRRIPLPRLSPGPRRLEGAVAHYLARVLRVRAGDAIVLFDPASGREGDARTLGVEHGSVLVDVGDLREGTVLPSRSLTWVQALAKGDKCDAIVRDATELGATHILVAATRRSVVKLEAARAAARSARWTRIAEQAARQCGRADAPRVDSPAGWGDALARVDAAHQRFCLWEGAREPLARPLFEALAHGAALAFASGPEGGFDDAEVDLARTSGWSVVSLGPRLLRTETVAAAVLGAVEVWSRWFADHAPSV
jgi:16S rRNA (uracil1498-N3)-methyltransferase